ncbi:MAG: hypothetical protein ACPLQP_11715 [Moorellaceae bacterium]
MTFSQVEELARKWARTYATDRQNIIRQVYATDGEDGLEVLARLLGLDARYLAWYAQLLAWRRARSRTRRGKDASTVFPRIRCREAAELAWALCGYHGGERRYAKRDASKLGQTEGCGPSKAARRPKP